MLNYDIYPRGTVKRICRKVHCGILLLLEAKGKEYNANIKRFVDCEAAHSYYALQDLVKEGLVTEVPKTRKSNMRIKEYELTVRGKIVANLMWALIEELTNE
jgi:DNA-binding PadR family transcriptional regulator